MRLRLRLLLSLLVLVSVLTPAQAATGGQPVTFQSGDQTAYAVLYLPPTGGRHPAIVVIHEWWGLNDWIKQQAADYAAQGYVALAVDLYRGQVATDPETAHELMRGLPQDRGVRDLVSAVNFLAARKDVDPTRIGAVGWCMGGGYAAQLAVADPTLRAVAINYGSLPTDPAAVAKIKAAVLGNFGGQDHGISAADVTAFADELRKDGRPVDVKIYPEAGHAFENPSNKNGYRPEDAADARHRMQAFFTRNLKK